MADGEEKAARVERRKERRFAINREFASVEQFVAEYAADISRSGVFIRSASPLPVGTQIVLRFSILADEIETVEGVGEVVRIVSPGGTAPSGMGIVFIELAPGSKALLERLLVRAPP